MEAIITLAITAGVVAFIAISVYTTGKLIGWQDAKRRLAECHLHY